MEPVPEAFHDLLEGSAVAHFVTLLPDGSPHVSPVWIDRDGDHLLVNTAEGRRKERNVRRNPAVALSITDPDDAYRFVSVRGAVVAVTTDGADDHIDALARRYLGVDEYPSRGAGTAARVVVRIRPDHVSASTREQRKAERGE